uniref:AMP-binding protein n=1 Tax=Aldersonia kunmingensis TaxID=408066 RepID=UPI000A685A19
DLQVTVQDAEEGLGQATLTYSTDLFDESTAQRYALMIATLIGDIVRPESANTSVGDLELLTPAERAAFVPMRADVDPVVPETFVELLTRGVARAGSRPALLFGDVSVSYHELDDWSSRLARVLIEIGVNPDTVVAVAIPRSIESIVCLWAVAKAGAACMAIDPNYPAERIAYMLDDSHAELGITLRAADLPQGLPSDVTWIELRDPRLPAVFDRMSGEPIEDSDRVGPLHAKNTAYLVYTSGSTGTPKGVCVTHGGIANFAAELRDRFDIDSHSRTLHFSSPSFDASILEVLLAFPNGATMVIAPPDILGGPDLADLINRERVTHAFITPAALETMAPESV